jgi:hypothetical protein
MKRKICASRVQGLKKKGHWYIHFSINLYPNPLTMKMEAINSSKHGYLPGYLHGVKTQKATLWTITSMETWKLVIIVNTWLSFPHSHSNGRSEIIHRHDLQEFRWKIITKWIFKASAVIKVRTRVFITTSRPSGMQFTRTV